MYKIIVATLAASLAMVARADINRGICDGLKTPGVTPALYGLCVAYCEALDCAAPTNGDAPQCRVASPTILGRYNALKRASDPIMPCVKPACPCWTADELAKVGNTYSPHDFFQWLMLYPDVKLNDLEERASSGNIAYSLQAFVRYDTGSYVATMCQFTDIAIDWDTFEMTGYITAQQISSNEGAACEAQINEHVATLESGGVTVPCIGNACPAPTVP